MDNSLSIIGKIRDQSNEYIRIRLTQIGVKGIVASHGDILMMLIKFKELTMTEIAEKIHRDRSTVTTLVNKLIKLEIIKSKKNPKDSRSSLIFLTKKGKEFETDILNISKELYEIEYSEIPKEEREKFLKTLDKILNNFEQR